MTEYLVIAPHGRHVYLRVGDQPDNEGRRFDNTDADLFQLVRKTTKRKGKILQVRLLVVPSSGSGAAAHALMDATGVLRYNRHLTLPGVERRNKLVFCGPDRTLSDLERLVRSIKRNPHVLSSNVRWPFVDVFCKRHQNQQVEEAVCELMDLPFGKRDTLWNLKL